MTTIKLILLLSLLPFIAIAQPVVGFWKVDQVMAGGHNVTPVAKWFKINPDKTSQAGNGWSQNSIGSWTYDTINAEYLPFNSKGEPDEYGAFVTTFSGGKMFWERQENGMPVTVSLSKTNEMPISPKDSIVGRWELVEVKKGEQDVTPEYTGGTAELLDVWWTGTYHKTNPDSTRSHGYWYMDPHRPEFHMIDFNREVDIRVFVLSFSNDLVSMRLKKDRSMKFTYKRE